MTGGPAADFCLLVCLFVVVVVVNTETVRRKNSLPSVYVCWSVCIGIPTPTPTPPLIPSLSFSLSHAPQRNKHTHMQTDKYRCTAVCTENRQVQAHPCLCVPQFMCAKNKYHCQCVHETSTCIPLSMRARNKYMYTSVYAYTKQVRVYHCLCVQKTSTSVPQQLRESPSPSNCWTRAQR